MAGAACGASQDGSCFIWTELRREDLENKAIALRGDAPDGPIPSAD